MTVQTFVGFPYFFGDNWCARCASCREVLTKFAFTEGEARKEAGSVEHRCGKVQR